jgi:hypothetical protein
MRIIESKRINSIEGKRRKREDEIGWRGFIRVYIYAESQEHPLTKSAKIVEIEKKFQFVSHMKPELGAEIEQEDFTKGDKYLNQYIAGKSAFSELGTLTESRNRPEENVDLPMLNARVERIEENRACCMVNFQGFPMRVSFPKDVLEANNLHENNLFLWRPVIGKEISPFDCIPLRTDGSLSEEDIEYILETMSDESRAKTQ